MNRVFFLTVDLWLVDMGNANPGSNLVDAARNQVRVGREARDPGWFLGHDKRLWFWADFSCDFLDRNRPQLCVEFLRQSVEVDDISTSFVFNQDRRVVSTESRGSHHVKYFGTCEITKSEKLKPETSALKSPVRAHDFMLWLLQRSEREIVVGTHSAPWNLEDMMHVMLS